MQSYGGESSVCVPAAKDGSNVCDYHETCMPEAHCATKNTVCSEEECRLSGRRTSCNGKVCQGATPMCCSDANGDLQCMATCPSSGGGIVRKFYCSGSRSCPKGMVCMHNGFGSACYGDAGAQYQRVNAKPICETVADCPPQLCKRWWNQPSLKTQCRKGPKDEFGACVCE